MFDIVFLKNFAHLNNYPRTRWSWNKNLIDYESVIDDYLEIHLTNSLYIFLKLSVADTYMYIK